MSEANTNNPGDTNLNWFHPKLGQMDDDDPRIDRFCIDLINQEIMEADEDWNGTDYVISAGTKDFLEALGIDKQAAENRAFADCAEAVRLEEANQKDTIEHFQASKACQEKIDEAQERSWNKAHRAATPEDVDKANRFGLDLEVGSLILDVKELNKQSSFGRNIKGGTIGIRGEKERAESSQCELDAIAAVEDPENTSPFFVYPDHCFS